METSGVNRLQKTDQDTKVGTQLLWGEGIHRTFFRITIAEKRWITKSAEFCL